MKDRKLKKIAERLTVFVVGLPLVLSSVYFFSQYHFLFLHIEIFITTAIGIFETQRLLGKRMAVYPFFMLLPVGMILPVISYLNNAHIFPHTGFLFALALAFLLICAIEIGMSFFVAFDKSIQRMCSAAFIIFYPGFFVSFVSKMTKWQYASEIITVFLFMVLICDSAAWLFGMLFGKSNRGFFPASPNKSIAGFAGGIFASMVGGTFAYFVFPYAFAANLTGCLLLGFATAIAAISGDLIESIMKRSADIKDSGSVILGRGGVLDSIDSILIAAPVFYLFYRLCVGQY